MATPQSLTPEQIAQIVAAGQGGSVNLGGTIYQPQFTQLGGGEGGSLGPLEAIYGYTPEQNKVGGTYNQYDPTGVFSRSGTQQEVNANSDFLKFLAGSALTFALPGAINGSLFGTGAATAAPAAGDVWAAEMAGAAPASEVAAATAAANGATAGLTASQIANLAKAGITAAGLLGAKTALSGSNSSTPTTTAAGVSIPTQGLPSYTTDYFAKLQNAYNQNMPGMPRDVVSNLADWYGAGGNADGLFSSPTTTTPTQTTTAAKKAAPVNLGSAGYQWATNQGGMTPMQFLNNINQWILDNPNATADQIKAEKAKYGISDVDVQTALGQSTFSDATKYALTHNMGLSGVNKSIVDWLNANPTATNEQIQQAQSSVGVSDSDVARALAGTSYSPAAQWNVINDVGLNEMYKNIANAAANTAANGYTPEQAVAAMKQYGISPQDLTTAYSLFSPANALSLSDVLAAYNK